MGWKISDKLLFFIFLCISNAPTHILPPTVAAQSTSTTTSSITTTNNALHNVGGGILSTENYSQQSSTLSKTMSTDGGGRLSASSPLGGIGSSTTTSFTKSLNSGMSDNTSNSILATSVKPSPSFSSTILLQQQQQQREQQQQEQLQHLQNHNYQQSQNKQSQSISPVSDEIETPTEPYAANNNNNNNNGHELLGSAGPDNRESEGIQRALDLLREKRSSDFGWENDTHMVILAKELSGAREPNPDADQHIQTIQELEDNLSIKQMEIEILSMLDRNHLLPKPVNSDKLARYVLALGSLCKDPKRFHGHDLVAALQHHEPIPDQEFALTTLAVCSSAAHVRKRQIRRLLDIASGVTDQSVDTIAMVILALRCIVTDHRHRHLQHFVRRPARGLATLQGPRGSFGSLRSTALAMQALQDLETDPAGPWNRSAASKWILARQRDDGGWTEEPIKDGQESNIGIGLTADIILALGWKGLGAVRALQCDHVIRETSENPSENGEPKLAAPVGLTSSAEESEPKNITYSYTLWLGTNVTEAYSLSLISQKNTSFFRAMTQAADIDPRFTFEAREWPNGHYVHTLAGKKEEPRGYNYWLLYRLSELPDPSNPPGNQMIAPVGVDELMVEDGEHYLYWYKKL